MSHDDEHEHDVVMPGFRFHPTEEELIEFYLRRKVEGKRFNVELVTLLDLYRYDPWELPALSAIGENEWFFYVPRDRKYRNGDRPNRVTTSGYWKATGADRTIKSENLRSIGLKKTLVFYIGKAPKGIRTSWIMNEYRLPHHETEKLQKVEISLCRVYKRPGVEDHPSVPRSFPTKPSSSSSASSSNSKKLTKNNIATPYFQEEHETSCSSTNETDTASLGLSNQDNFPNYNAFLAPTNSPSNLQAGPTNPNCTPMFNSLSYSNLVPNSNHSVNDLHRLVNFQTIPLGHNQNYQIHPSSFSDLQPQSQTFDTALGSVQTIFPDRFWEWSLVTDQGNKDFNSFK